MTFFAYFSLAVYIGSLLHISIYCLTALWLWYFYITKKKAKKQKTDPKTEPKTDFYPTITVQLPLYNEPFVVERLLRCIADFDYPLDKLEIQVLDDSTDETGNLAKAAITAIQKSKKDLFITYFHRKNRTGFKAGALAAGLREATGEFIAIFDADFLPKPDFLRKSIAYFKGNEELGLLQTRWLHLNETESWLTRLQAMQLNVHFTIEQGGRHKGGVFTQFNGTAGVWRKAAIETAGGWQADTLTEDLDLSYRAQLAGWLVVYTEAIGVEAELPSSMHALLGQQFRWAKGGAECAKKLLPIIATEKLPFGKKIHAFLHLSASSIFVSMLFISVFSVFVSVLIDKLAVDLNGLLFFFPSTLFLILVHFTANIGIDSRGEAVLNWHRSPNIGRFFWHYPLLLAVSMGMSWRNSIGVLEAWTGRKSVFVRTQKKGSLSSEKTAWLPPNDWRLMELFFCFFLGIAACNDLVTGQYVLCFFHILWSAGFGLVATKP